MYEDEHLESDYEDRNGNQLIEDDEDEPLEWQISNNPDVWDESDI